MDPDQLLHWKNKIEKKTNKNKKKKTREISRRLYRKRLVRKGFVIWQKCFASMKIKMEFSFRSSGKEKKLWWRLLVVKLTILFSLLLCFRTGIHCRNFPKISTFVRACLHGGGEPQVGEVTRLAGKCENMQSYNPGVLRWGFLRLLLRLQLGSLSISVPSSHLEKDERLILGHVCIYSWKRHGLCYAVLG